MKSRHDNTANVARGDPFRGFDSRIWNMLIDKVAQSGERLSAPQSRTYRDASVIRVKNVTGTVLEQFEVVGLSETVYDPTDETELSAFTSSRCMDGEVPDFDDGHNIRYGIIQAPADTDEVVPCCVTGFSPVQLNVRKSWHKFAQPVDGETGYLESAPYGPAIIHWADAGEGETGHALVSIKSQPGLIILGKAKTNWNKEGGDGCYVNVYPCSDFAGTGADTANEIKVWLPRNGMDRDPNVEADDIIQCMMLDASTSTPEAVCISNYLDEQIGNYRFVLHSAIRPHPYVPRGWVLTGFGFNGKCLMFNDHTDKPAGADYHPLEVEPPGVPENVHIDHGCRFSPLIDFVDDEGSGVTGIQPILTYDYDFSHSQTSNWPPYAVLDMINRYDNSE